MLRKKTAEQRILEVALIVICVALSFLLYRVGPYRMVVLNLFYLPIVLAAFYLGRYIAGVLALLCVVSASVVTALDLGTLAAYASAAGRGARLDDLGGRHGRQRDPRRHTERRTGEEDFGAARRLPGRRRGPRAILEQRRPAPLRPRAEDR